MAFAIAVENGVVCAELAGAETAQETREFLAAVARYGDSHTSFLISARASLPTFRVEQQGLIDCLRAMAHSASHRIALLAASIDMQISYEYVELIARQNGLNVRSFGSRAEAVRWLGYRDLPDFTAVRRFRK
ncbi:MAG TPA: hypothetical protein VKB41_16785 [Steroidobacteraceae bacterium]|nr:hypothetical protein [Steroidobacteraceae bacterium]